MQYDINVVYEKKTVKKRKRWIICLHRKKNTENFWLGKNV